MRLPIITFLVSLLPLPAFAQETRSMIYGRVLDPQASAIAGARVIVTNTDTNTSMPLVTNETGYYEARLLLPGNYQVSAEAAGFRTSIRKGILLPVSTRTEINMSLELGAVAESVTVVAEAPLLDAASASSGRVLDNKTQSGLPVSSSNVTLLVRLSPGVQTNGQVRYLDAGDQGSASDYKVNGAVGGNEWSIDGAPNTGSGGRTVGYLPHSDMVSELKLETSGFDASIGHTTGVQVNLMSKSGTNQYHGSLSEQHTQNRWNAAPFFAAQNYYRRIADAEAQGDHALAEQLRNSPKQTSGRINQYTGTLGGPIVIPKILNGRDKLFFFFAFSGYREIGTASSQYLNYTFPRMSERLGDFSQLQKVDAVRYTIYDPLSVRPDPARQGHYIRDPIPNNILPSNRINNPSYNAYLKFLPIPNNDPTNPKLEPQNNYIGWQIPQNEEYESVLNRVDYNLSDKHRFYLRWQRDHYYLDALDWAYESYRGLMTSGGTRHNISAIGDWIYTPRPTTILDFSFAINEYRYGDRRPIPLSFKPSDVGLPTYLDDHAGAQHILPYMSFSGYNSIGYGGVPAYDRVRNANTKLEASHITGKHSLRAGFDFRNAFHTGGGGGNTSGYFSFSNTYTRRNDDSLTPAGSYGHSWAAFMMGIPGGMSIAESDSYAAHTPYYAWYFQDNWRITPKLNLTLGLRNEYEMGYSERYNRMMTYFDQSATVAIADAAVAAYGKNPLPERPVSDFVVQGGPMYAGVNGAPRRAIQNQFMWLPRIAAAYQLDSKTVLRGGYGIFYDTLNATIFTPNQYNYSRTTSTVLTNDFGATWLAGDPVNGISPMTDPFPIRADGTRYDVPLKSALGQNSLLGRSFTYNDFNTRHARQQRWRFGVQRQIGTSMLLDVAYAGTASGDVYISKNLMPLAEQYWADGLVRNDAVANNLNQNLPNPFYIGNFASLKDTNPLVYNDMSTNSFFTSRTIRKSSLLRPFPFTTGLTQSNAPYGMVHTDELDISFEKRFSKGFNFYAAYTRLRDDNADFYYNEFDANPTWRESNNGRPHRFIATSVFELPFGKGKPLAKSGPVAAVVGGWQLGVTFEWQPGPLLDWGNLFYYGELSDINTGTRTWDQWFNTANFERNASKSMNSFHERVFPTHIDGLRSDMTNNWNADVQRDIKFTERLVLQLRMDVLNPFNRTQMDVPVTNPLATNFGKITQQSWTAKRYVQIRARLTF